MITRTACLFARDTDAYRNQAVEKHLMDTLPEDTAILFLWQDAHAFALGRNQDAWTQCRVDALTQDGGQVVRRLSGGASVYRDPGCLNFSFILPKTQFDIPRQLSIIGMAAGALGVQAQAAPRGDLCVSGRRFCQNAYFKYGAHALHHGTLAVNCGFGSMRRYLPDNAVTRDLNLCEVVPGLDLHTLAEALFHAFGHAYGAQPVWLDETMLDSRSIASLTQAFAAEAWLFPPRPAPTLAVTERFPWGNVTVELVADSGVIRSAQLFTDAMEAPLFTAIGQMLVGAPYLISAIAGRFDQRLSMVTDLRLRQQAADVCKLICGHIRANDRQG